LRSLFQVNVEEGRHLWAMVYLLHGYFGRDGREEAEELLGRHSGDADRPRILSTFNEPIADWLSFFMFTYFTDRDGKFQLMSFAESGFDPLARTCRFMLMEEAHHMMVGVNGIARIVKRTLEVMAALKTDEPDKVRAAGAIDLPTIQRYLNFWFSSSLDLFGAEVSTNAAAYFANGINCLLYTSLACDEILMIDDRSSTVSLPEVALLGVLPGTGGLSRLIDKRKVRRDLADVFCTTSEGVRAARAKDWNLVDAVALPQRFAAAVTERALALAATSDRTGDAKGVALQPLARQIDETGYRYPHLNVEFDRVLRTAALTITGPDKTTERAEACLLYTSRCV